jgi:NAD(P)H-binding
MAKYVLFGPTNETALHFIRHASSANLKIICLYPYDARKSYIDRNSPLIYSLGGIPQKYNFRSTKSGTDKSQGKKALQNILRDVKGVVWAADPDLRETTLSRPDERFTEYLEDLRNTLSLMSERDGPKRFLCLAQHSIHEREGSMKGNDIWWESYGTRRYNLHTAVSELVNYTMKSKLEWTILRVGKYLDGNPPLTPDERGIELEAKPLDSVWRDDVARTMVEILKADGLSKMLLDLKSGPATDGATIADAIEQLTKSGAGSGGKPSHKGTCLY